MKPCPFCPDVKSSVFFDCYKVTTKSSRYFGLWRIGCGSCGFHAYKMTQEEAVKFWNTRKDEEIIKQYDEGIEKVIKEIQAECERIKGHNIGKRGCIRRLQILQDLIKREGSDA